MRKKIFIVIFIAWVIVRASFVVREIFFKGGLCDWRELLSRSLDGKRSYVTGDRFYEFLAFCGRRLPEGATYEWVGTESGSHDQRRSAYYLYPHLEKKGRADFLLVCGKGAVPEGGYEIFDGLDHERYILKKMNKR